MPCSRHVFLGADCVEVRKHLLQRQPHQLRELPRDAELVRPLFEGGLEDFVAAVQLVGDVPQSPQGLIQQVSSTTWSSTTCMACWLKVHSLVASR